MHKRASTTQTKALTTVRVRVYVRCVRACACERAALVARVVERRRETSGANFNCEPLPAPVLGGGAALLVLVLLVGGAVAGPDRRDPDASVCVVSM